MAEGSAPSATELKQPLVMGPPPLLGSGRTFSRTRRPSLTLPLFVLVVCRPDWPDCWLIASQFEVVQVAGIKAKQCYPSFTYLEFNLSWNIFHRPVISFFLRPSSWNTSAGFFRLITEKYWHVQKHHSYGLSLITFALQNGKLCIIVIQPLLYVYYLQYSCADL